MLNLDGCYISRSMLSIQYSCRKNYQQTIRFYQKEVAALLNTISTFLYWPKRSLISKKYNTTEKL